MRAGSRSTMHGSRGSRHHACQSGTETPCMPVGDWGTMCAGGRCTIRAEGRGTMRASRGSRHHMFLEPRHHASRGSRNHACRGPRHYASQGPKHHASQGLRHHASQDLRHHASSELSHHECRGSGTIRARGRDTIGWGTMLARVRGTGEPGSTTPCELETETRVTFIVLFHIMSCVLGQVSKFPCLGHVFETWH